jgi:hypothetical protein
LPFQFRGTLVDPTPELFRDGIQSLREYVTMWMTFSMQQRDFCIIPLAWEWKGGGHLTLLCFDHKNRIQWFYDPAETRVGGFHFLQHMATTDAVLSDGYEPRVVRSDVQMYLEEAPCVRVGCCSTAVLLFAVLVVRFRAFETLQILSDALSMWAMGLDLDDFHPVGQLTNVNIRLYAWQKCLTEAADHNDQHTLRLLLGWTLSPARSHLRTCGAFRDADGNQCQRPALSPESLCEEHWQDVLRLPTP